MSTEIITAVEKAADLSKLRFVPLLQLLNILGEGRSILFLSSWMPHHVAIQSGHGDQNKFSKSRWLQTFV